MRYRVRPTRAALDDVVAIGEWIADQATRAEAGRWVSRVVAALSSLDEMPERCPIAPEDPEVEPEIRHLILVPYRILFTLAGRDVFVLHVRHGHRRSASPEDLTAGLEEGERENRPRGE